MDPITHGLAGALAGSIVAPRHEIRVAGFVAGLAAVVPDADLFLPTADDPLLALELHRQFSHSLVVIPVIAILVAGGASLIPKASIGRFQGKDRLQSFLTLCLYAGLGAGTAGVLDACTSYGTELLWPWFDQRFAWGILPVVDPLLTIVAGTAVALTMVRMAPAHATWGALFVTAYLGLGWIQHERAAFVAQTVAGDRGHHFERMVVKPAFGTLLLWRSVYLTKGLYHVDVFRLGPASDIVIYAGETIPAVNAKILPLPPDSVQGRDVARFERIAAGFTVLHPVHPWVLGDVRFSLIPDRASPLWGLQLAPDAPSAHAQFVSFRDVSFEVLTVYLDMLLGRPMNGGAN